MNNNKIIYHAFTDYNDGFYNNLKEAIQQIREWHKSGETSLRINIERYRTKEDYENEIYDEENFFSLGPFPY